MKAGTNFEKLIENIYQKLAINPNLEKVERDVLVKGKDGNRQVDILVTTKTAGIEVFTVIECKDHNRKLSVGFVDNIHSKLQDINGNKGILVSRKGFSSKAISKAKRLGITLCTAHEALSKKWSIDLEVPILAREIIPKTAIPHASFIVHRQVDWEDIFQNKDFNLKTLTLFQEKWEAGSLDIEMKNKKQYIDLFDYIENKEFSDDNGIIGEITELKIELVLEFNYYFGYLNEIDNTKLLKDITSGKSTFFIDKSSFFEYVGNLKRVKVDSIPSIEKIPIKIFVRQNLNIIGFDKSSIYEKN